MQKHQNRMKSGVEGPQAPEKMSISGPSYALETHLQCVILIVKQYKFN